MFPTLCRCPSRSDPSSCRSGLRQLIPLLPRQLPHQPRLRQLLRPRRHRHHLGQQLPPLRRVPAHLGSLQLANTSSFVDLLSWKPLSPTARDATRSEASGAEHRPLTCDGRVAMLIRAFLTIVANISFPEKPAIGPDERRRMAKSPIRQQSPGSLRSGRPAAPECAISAL
jgi:hypothetical protein